jgi:hypothetical protein
MKWGFTLTAQKNCRVLDAFLNRVFKILCDGKAEPLQSWFLAPSPTGKSDEFTHQKNPELIDLAVETTGGA